MTIMNISRWQKLKPLIYRLNVGVSSINAINYEDNCQRLTNILSNALVIYKNRRLKNEKLYAYNLAHKFLNHVYAVLILIKYEREINQPYLSAEISMLPSIQVLVRASFEAYLTFDHIFIAPQTKEEKDFRYLRYVYSGYFERSEFVLLYEIAEHDRNISERLKRKLKANNIFRTLGTREKDKILDGKWKLESWPRISLKAGFSQEISDTFYKYLCGYAHSGSLSVRQLSQVLSTGQQFITIDSLVVLLNICLAKMIKSYCAIFIETKTKFSEQDISFVNLWAAQAECIATHT